MNDPNTEKLYTRIYNVAQFQTQVAITLLPLGAGAAGFIGQQSYTFPILTALILIWLGLFVISISIILSLRVISTEHGNLGNYIVFKNNYQKSILTFILGIFCIVISPAGFAINRYLSSPQIVIKASSEIYRVSYTQKSTLNLTMVISSDGITDQEYQSLRIESVVSDPACISVTKKNELPPVNARDTWLTVWDVSVTPGCTYGDYLILYKLWQGTEMRGQTRIIIKVEK